MGGLVWGKADNMVRVGIFETWEDWLEAWELILGLCGLNKGLQGLVWVLQTWFEILNAREGSFKAWEGLFDVLKMLGGQGGSIWAWEGLFQAGDGQFQAGDGQFQACVG